VADWVAARQLFKQALELQRRGRDSEALKKFSAATDIDAAMADAWLGRIIAGDESLQTLRAAYDHGDQLGREAKLNAVDLKAQVLVGPYLVITATNRTHVGIALASALIDNRQYAEAATLLDDPTLIADPTGWHWRQYARTYLMHATQRWPDVIAEAAADLPADAIILHDITAAASVLAAMAAACLGQPQVALQWADKAHTQNAALLADLAYTRGMVHRQLGETAKATEWLGNASINGQLIETAKAALRDPAIQLAVVDETEIATRTNEWDASTQKTRGQQDDDELAARRAELLEEGKRELARQIGLQEVKDTVRRLEEQIPVRALRLKRGLQVPGQTNHMLLVGPPGTGKTTTAEALGKIYAGLGVVRHPEIIEVKRSDFCAEHIGASGPRTNELIDRSLGRILFMDEFYSLVERHQDGRPDMIGMEAVNQLLVALEVHRFDFCFMGAGYEDRIDEFLKVNPGLASRFNGRLRFTSYKPSELVDIADVYGETRDTMLDAAARQEFLDACIKLEQFKRPNDDGIIETGIDILHNGRFARNVIENAEEYRESRLSAQAVDAPDSLTDEDLRTITADDIVPAIRDACDRRHIELEPS
jgi:type VII secretion ATPase EccA